MNKETNMFSELEDIFKKQIKAKKAWNQKLEQLPIENVVIPREEIKIIQKLRTSLLGYMENIEKQRADHEKNPQLFSAVLIGGEQEKRALVNMINMLDKYDDIWQCKFSTESQGSGVDLVETPYDSIYYMTHSGASIRFKMANIKEGLRKVVQPFAEFIYFHDFGNGISETPKPGYFTKEFFTKEFKDLLSGEAPQEDYQSLIKRYYQNGKLVDIPKTDKVTFVHDGSPVNKIFFENKK